MTLSSVESSPVLIASSESDRGTTQPVAEKLQQRGREVILLETDRIDSGQTRFAARIAQGALEVCLEDKTFDPSEVAAAWYRRPVYYGLDGTKTNDVGKFASSSVYTELYKGIYSGIPDARWLNAPSSMHRAENKLGQLMMAQSLGLTIPDTLVTNKWQLLNEFPHDPLIAKFAGMPIVPNAEGGFDMLYANVVPSQFEAQAAEELSGTPDSTLYPPFPVIWQPYVTKSREWRLTIVGDRCFDAAIYTSEEAKDDWRRHQLDVQKVRFKKENFPDTEKQACFQMLGKLGLRFGIFEFIESADGQLTFLELNSNGQYGWLEDELGFPLNDAIADELCAIADGTTR